VTYAKLAFGEYGAWIDANCPFGSRQGRRYVAEYEREKIDRMKSQPPPEPPPAETPPPPEPPPGTILKITDEKKHPIFNGGRCPKCNTRKIKLVEPEDPRDVRYFECQICGTCVEVRWNPLDSFDEEGWREPGEGKLDWMR